MRIGLVASLLLLTATVPATAQVRLSINIGSYPTFTAVPGYPVYYAPDVSANYFFYDGLYWLYQDDNWYSSSWYNGPWDSVTPMYVPIYILQIPVRYYRRPPQYFRGWQPDQSPRWNDHWGHNWAQRRPNWNRPRHEVNVAPAPLPDYQRKYSGKDYPRADQQQVIRQQNYHYLARRPDTSRDPDRRSDEKAREPQDRAAQDRNNVGPRERDKKQKPHPDQAEKRDQKRDQDRDQNREQNH